MATRNVGRVPATGRSSSCGCQLWGVGGGCQLTAQGARKSHLCADQCVLRKCCFGRSRSLPCVVCGLRVPPGQGRCLPQVGVQFTYALVGRAAAGQFAKEGGRGKGQQLSRKGRFSTNPKPERGIFGNLNNPKPDAGAVLHGK